MTEQVFFYIVILAILFFGLLNVVLDLRIHKKMVSQLKDVAGSIDSLWLQINRIDDEFKNVNAEKIKHYNELKSDILFYEKKNEELNEKRNFAHNIHNNRLNTHAKRLVYLKRVLDKLFNHKVEVRHKEKLLKLAGDLEKW